MFGRLAIVLALPALAFAQGCMQTSYEAIPGFAGSNGCVPSGYFQAQDLGNTNPSDLKTRCEAQCTAYNGNNGNQNCRAFVGQLFKAADSNLYSGQCFYYAAPSVPTAARQCADHPTIIVGEVKRTVLQCFSSSAVVASAFCSSYLAIPTRTVFTTTITPVVTTSTTFVVTVPTITSTTITSTITISTTAYQQTTTTSFTTTTTTTSTTTFQQLAKKRTVAIAMLAKRAAAPTPACLQATPVPASIISSACSCLSIQPRTLSTFTSAPTSTSISKSTTTTFSTSTATISTTTRTTPVTTEVSTTTTVSTTTATTTTVIPVQCRPSGAPCSLSQFGDECCSHACAGGFGQENGHCF